MHNAHLSLTLYNAWGYVLAASHVFADPSDLAPGQSAPFEVVSDHFAGANRHALVADATR